MADALIPVFTGIIADATVQLCDARALHIFMEVKRDFTTWIKGRIRKFGFIQNADYLLTKSGEQVPHQGGTRTVERIDYHLTLDMAKELAMVENNEQGRAARKYFIACERELLAQQPARAPYTVQPTDTLSEPQQIALRALLESNVKRLPHDKQAAAMVKGWSKLKSHFGVPYRQIPASEFTEAVSIVARHVADWELVEDAQPAPTEPSMDRTRSAFDAAAQAAASVQTAVFNAVLSGNDDWQHQRLILSLIPSQPGAPAAHARALDRNAFITTWPRLIKDVANGEAMCTSEELIQMASACLNRLEQRSTPVRLAA